MQIVTEITTPKGRKVEVSTVSIAFDTGQAETCVFWDEHSQVVEMYYDGGYQAGHIKWTKSGDEIDAVIDERMLEE